MFILKLTLLALALLAFATSVLAHPPPPPFPKTASPEALAALEIINDLTPKFLMNITFTDEATMQNVTAKASYICDTTGGSPSVFWVREVSSQLRSTYKWSMCQQRNPWGSRRTKLLGLGDAAVSICTVRALTWTWCDAVGYAAIGSRVIVLGMDWRGGRFFFEDFPPTEIAVHKNH
ncbi:hypothetical protein L873DRAFT_1794775 [Choiromyces venosus 120613-1]|uniref:Ig-like domain-containing protein n=1 Tax=Choiromyces venosus 120613-1 TaxID=1336337 RepID=A0A3N4J3A5_9PEZI|nr:hypothetical protein L873DRAFT_1794775 [Choiromyces venosus 120613-1]